MEGLQKLCANDYDHESPYFMTGGSGAGKFTNAKKKSNPVSQTMKRALWDMYIGLHVKQAKCLLCGTADIHLSFNSGYDSAHIIADRYFDKQMSVYYAIPSCKSCNNICNDMCVIDFLFTTNRLDTLRKVIRVVYKTYIQENTHSLAPEARLAYAIIHHLYGPDTFRFGGIQNTKPIYEIARMVQYHDLLEESRMVAHKQLEINKQMTLLLDPEIRPLKFT